MSFFGKNLIVILHFDLDDCLMTEGISPFLVTLVHMYQLSFYFFSSLTHR